MKRALEAFDYWCVWLYVKVRFAEITPEQLDYLILMFTALYYMGLIVMISLWVYGD